MGASPEISPARSVPGTQPLIRRGDYLAAGGSPARLRTQLRRGDLVSVATGVYVDGQTLAPDDPWAEFIARTRAFVLASPDNAIAAGWSAVGLLGLPHPPKPPDLPEVIRQSSRGSGSNRTPRGHTRFAAVPDRWVTTVHGTRCLHPAFVAVELARSIGPRWSLILADAAALRCGSTAPLRSAMADMIKWPRIRRAAWAVDNADLDAESALESAGRAVMLDAHPVAPQSNVWLGVDYPMIRVDHWWADGRIAAEGDGIGKYGSGQEAGKRLLEEKDREFLFHEWSVRWLRYDWRRVFNNPERLAYQLQRLHDEPAPTPHPGLRTWSNQEGRLLRGLPTR